MLRLPAELLDYIIHLAHASASPSLTHHPDAPGPRSTWAELPQLSLVSQLFHRFSRPHLFRTITLDSDQSLNLYFGLLTARQDGADLFSSLDRGWLGNISAAKRQSIVLDPLQMGLNEAGWYEEIAGGFIIGHHYAACPRINRRSKKRSKGVRRVSVYWAEEEIIEELSSQSGSEQDDDDEPPPIDERPAWQILYANNRRRPTARETVQRMDYQGPRRRHAMTGTVNGPTEGDLDPWDMVEAQARMIAEAEVPRSPSLAPLRVSESHGLDDLLESRKQQSQTKEIYAYHLVTATLENWINRFFSEIRTLRYITITFYPGHLLDDDKLEHVLRRILSSEENPRLEQLLIRIAYEPTAAGSRFRRLDRAKTIGGAVERIGDERIRVEGLSAGVGSALLCPSQIEAQLTPSSQRAVMITKEGWWARILQQNRLLSSPSAPSVTDEREPFSSAFGSAEAAKRLRPVMEQADPFPDDPVPIDGTCARNGKVTVRGRGASSTVNDLLRQTTYVNAWAARDTLGTNEAIEE